MYINVDPSQRYAFVSNDAKVLDAELDVGREHVKMNAHDVELKV